MASAKQIRDEIMKMTIIVNSNPAQQEIYKLTDANRKLAEESTKLRAEREKVRQTLGKESQDYKDLTQKINDNSLTISNNKRKMQELTDSLDINQMSVKQLRQELTLLKRELDRTVPGSNQYNALQERIGQVTTRLGEVRNGARSTQMSFQQLADKFNHYSGIVTAVAAVLIGFGLSVQNVIDRNNKMADAMSQVEKNVNMTRQEVEALTRSFSDMDTRTKKIDLLKIATAGGRLGVAKEDIKDFVVEVDKANVALGDSWEGGADKIAEEIGRIALSYEETKNQPIAKSISEIGSALNELAADGASSESNIADFMNRLGSLPPSMKPPINTLLGLGAALEESSIKAEIGSSGISKFFRVAGNNVEAFADVMQRPVQEVKDLINSNPAEFFLQFSEGLKGLEATDVTQILEKLKLNDNEVQRVIGAATDKSERFREVIEKSNQAFKERTSLQIEFDKVNNNSAAVYEKLQKKLAEIFTSETFARFLNDSINALSLFLGVNEKAENSLGVFGRTILTVVRAVAIFSISLFSLGATITAYNLLIKDSIAREIILNGLLKVKNATTSISTIVQSGYNLVVGKGGEYLSKLIGFIALKTSSTRLETTATNLQTAAQERLNKVTKANPFGLIISVLSVAITAYITYKSLVEDTATAQEQLNEVLKEGAKNAGAEINAIEQTYKKLTNKNIAEKERQTLLDNANKQYPGYFNNLSTEDFLLGKAVGQYHKLRAAIVAASQARAADAKINEIAGKYLEKEVELNGKVAFLKKRLKTETFTDETRTYSGAGGGGVYTVKGSEKKMGVEVELEKTRMERDQLLKDKLSEINPLLSIVDKNPFKKQETATPDITPTYKVPGSTDTTKSPTENSAENAHKQMLEDYKRRADEAGKLSVELEKEINGKKIEAMEDGFAKELALIDEQERQKLAELENKKITPEEIAKLQEITAKATGTDKDFFKALLTQWETNNKQLEQAKTAEIQYYANKRGALIQKNAIEEQKRSYDLFQKELQVLNREKNEKIGALTTVQDQINFLREKKYTENLDKIKTWEEGAAAIEKYYQAQSLKRQLEFLKTKVAVLNAMVVMGDATLMTPENLKTIEDYKNKIAELQAEIARLLNKEESKTPKKLSVGGKTDILGLSTDDWDTLFKNIESGKIGLDSWIAGIEAVKNAFNSYYSLVQAKEQAQVRQVEVAAKRKEKSLKNQLDRGIISQEEYEASIQSLNEETERKKAQLEYEAAKRQRVFQIAQIVANTAQAIMSIYSTGGGTHYLDFGVTANVLAAIVAGIGAMQVATVLATPLPEAPGYEQGFGMEYDMMREQDGKKFRTVRRRLTSGLVDRPTHFIAGENGVEMVIDNPTYTKFPESVKRTLNRQIAIAKGYEGGRYPYLSNPNETPSPKDDLMMELLIENREAIRELRKTRFTAVVDKNDMRSAKNIIEMQDDYNYLKNK